MTAAQRHHRWMVVLAFGLVYVFWGSTYLGIRIAVEHLPPAVMCGTRFVISGVLMLAYCALAGRNIRYRIADLGRLSIVGVLLLVGGNLTLSWAEQTVPSGLAALIIAVTPLWFLVLDSWLIGHHQVSRRGLAGLGLGIIGLIVLLWPKLMSIGTLGYRQFVVAAILPLASFSWALGSVLSKRFQIAGDPFSATGWQMTAAGVTNLLVALITGEFRQVVWTRRGIGAVIYLVICGSWIGYTAYIWLLEHVPTSKVSTYAYVNPVVAVFLGWIVLHEQVDHYILLGSAIVVASVILVTSAKVTARPAPEQLPAVEAAGD
jgi:drug/metabolite transporter (DMT)-like permease